MKILLLHQEKSARDIIAFCLESEVGATVHAVTSFQEAIEHFLGDSEINLVVTTENPETDKLLKYILSTGAELFVVLLTEKSQEATDTYPDIKVLAQMPQSAISTKLVPILKDQFRKILEGRKKEDFCRIDPSLLLRVAPLRGDIYIRLSSVKFVKLYRSGVVFSKDDLERVTVKKKLSSLYIRKNETQEFMNKFKLELESLIELASTADPHQPDPTLLDTAFEVQEVVRELTGRLGFTDEVREIAKQNVKLTIQAIGASPRLSKALAVPQLKNKNYISSHSIMLAHLTCSIAAQMDWPSDTTFHKLVLASLFHDHILFDSAHAKLSNKQQLEDLKGTGAYEEYTAIKTHGFKAAEVVQSLREIPSDVDTILLQHHERPDGSGFPAGLRSAQIAPLSAVFIVAHDIVDELILKKNAFSLDEFLTQNKDQYQTGTFKKIWKALTNADDTEDSSAA